MIAARDPHRQGGYTLLELMFVVAISGIVISSIVRFAFQTHAGLSHAELAMDLAHRNGRIAANIQTSVHSAIILYPDPQGDPNITAMRSLVQQSVTITGAPAPVNFTAPAVIAGLREPNLAGGDVNWGNELMFLANLGPYSFTASYSAILGEQVTINRYQMVYIYLAMVPGTAFGASGPILRLVEWRSKPLVSAVQITGFTNNYSNGMVRLSATCSTLQAAGYNLAIDISNPALPPATAFYTIVSPSAAVAGQMLIPGINGSLPEESWAYLDEFDGAQNQVVRIGDHHRVGSGANFGSVVGPYNISMAYDDVSPSTGSQYKVLGLVGPGGPITVPLYGQVDRAVPGFPGGFEVTVVGSSSAREVYVHQVMMGVSGDIRMPFRTYQAHEISYDLSYHGLN